MGHMLEKPITAKESDSGVQPKGRNAMSWASSCMQGWRNGMEDAHICLTELPSPSNGVAMFGVLDGHGGEQVAKFCAQHLPERLQELLDERQEVQQDRPVLISALSRALTDSFHEMDELLRSGSYAAELKALTNPPCPEVTRQMPPRNGPVDCNMVGCTCNIVCITEEYMLCANAGDSRAVLCRGGRAVPLSEDHKPNQPTEEKRIKAGGGWVETQHTMSGNQYRVNGNLNLSRALGDLEYKKDRSRGPEEQVICATPDFMSQERCGDDEFIVICCDGVWDVKSNQEVVDFVRQRLPETGAPQSIVEELLDACVSPDLRATRGLGGDNMTAVLIRFSSPDSMAGISSNGFVHEVSLPAVSSPKVQILAQGSGTGLLIVSFSFGKRPSALQDVCLGLCERTGELELSLAGSSAPQKFLLQNHLPKGAEFHFPTHDSPVKFSRKSNTLRAKLPWRQK